MNGHVRGGGRGHGRDRHVCNHHDPNFHSDDLYVLDAIRRKFFHTPLLSQNYLHSYYIHRNLRIHICQFDGCDTNVELKQNSLLHQLAIYIWAERMDESYLFEKKKKN